MTSRDVPVPRLTFTFNPEVFVESKDRRVSHHWSSLVSELLPPIPSGPTSNLTASSSTKDRRQPWSQRSSDGHKSRSASSDNDGLWRRRRLAEDEAHAEKAEDKDEVEELSSSSSSKTSLWSDVLATEVVRSRQPGRNRRMAKMRMQRRHDGCENNDDCCGPHRSQQCYDE
jgi:hypothetical protein